MPFLFVIYDSSTYFLLCTREEIENNRDKLEGYGGEQEG